MGKPAARVGDPHVCPMFDGLKPHVGGVLLPPGCPTVLIGGQPAIRVGDMGQCVSPAPNVVTLGSMGVLIGGMPAARMGDMMAHGGTITMGFPTVMIGEIGGISPAIGMIAAVMAGAVVSSFPGSSAVAGAVAGALRGVEPVLAGVLAGAFATKPANETKDRSWFQAQVQFEDDTPAPNVAYELVLPDGSKRTGVTDSKGMVREGGVPPGQCKFSLSDLDADAWERT
jgi:uncharacterized Zn-binding protein involved in type VI secretion